jgi:hypothetical protein
MMAEPENIEIDCTALVDGLIRDCLAANVPPLPAVLAEVLAEILCRGTATERAVTFAQLLILTRARVELLNTMRAPN